MFPTGGAKVLITPAIKFNFISSVYEPHTHVVVVVVVFVIVVVHINKLIEN